MGVVGSRASSGRPEFRLKTEKAISPLSPDFSTSVSAVTASGLADPGRDFGRSEACGTWENACPGSATPAASKPRNARRSKCFVMGQR